MGQCLAQHLGIWNDSYLVNHIEYIQDSQLLGNKRYIQVQSGSTLVHSSCWFATHLFHNIFKANSLMFDSSHCGQLWQGSCCLCKQCIYLVCCIHWVYRRVKSFDLQNVLIMDRWMLRLKYNYLDCHHSQLMGLQMVTYRVFCQVLYLYQQM